MNKIKKLGKSVFNYQLYSEELYSKESFIHYYQQIHHILKLKPYKILEIGPGDHTVADFLIRKGIEVKTFDNNKELFPDYFGDVRKIDITEQFDLILISEVLEHLDFKYFKDILERLSKLTKYIVISVPYASIRLRFFAKGKISSDGGNIITGIPYFWKKPKIYDNNNFRVHHWAVGMKGYSRNKIKESIPKSLKIIEEKRYLKTNAYFLILRRRNF